MQSSQIIEKLGKKKMHQVFSAYASINKICTYLDVNICRNVVNHTCILNSMKLVLFFRGNHAILWEIHLWN